MDGEAPAADPAGGLKLGEDGLPIAQEEAKEESVIPEEVMQDMENLWSVFDMQNTQKVEIKHLRVIMRALDFDLGPEELAVVQEQIDPNREGIIRFPNLKEVMEEKLKDKDTVEDMMAQLKHLDLDGDGLIPIPEFKQYMQNLGAKMTPEQIDELMKEADTKGDGMVYIEEVATRLCPPKPTAKK